MLKLLVYFVAAIAVVAARQSPHAARVLNQESKFSKNIYDIASLDAPDLIKWHGYPSEIHNVVTEDGYILEIHRIPHGRVKNNQPGGNKPVVFIMHGLLSSSAGFLLQGPEKSIPYILAEEGYDVWLGNARGNYYSRRHVTLNPDSDSNFWRFSWDEIGNLDLAVSIDYALGITGQKKLHYIGHSQGGTTFLVLNSLRPEFSEKFISFQGLAPAAFFEHNESPLFTQLAPYEKVLDTMAFLLGVTEVGALKCKKVDNSTVGSLLESLSCLDMLGNDFSRYQEIEALILAHSPAGASVRQLSHYGQCIRNHSFRRFNHDLFTNIQLYRSSNPPNYDLSKVTVPSYIHYGLSDIEVNYRDIYTLAAALPNAVALQVPYSGFDHVDFLWHPNVVTLLYKTVLASMRAAEQAKA